MVKKYVTPFDTELFRASHSTINKNIHKLFVLLKITTYSYF